ncbi:hypothetical protein B0J11DRAFT_26764 [Dendryphion nanum]|uniref:Extracellular serine-rich protein n=1 Tax=Dendryphion nanum TaxID=256645 RepID=A0A9P9EKP8_9PLEO|nr:hypothetical protein B0J11DRAFT_26764 [Dendryphion nanum]
MISSIFLVALSAIPLAFAGEQIPSKSATISTGLAVAQHVKSSTTAALAAHATGIATHHTVQVGRNSNLPKDNQLVFNPETVIAKVGDVVNFKFYPKNHTVNRATFDAPCQAAKENAIFSGFVGVKGDIGADVVSETTFSIVVKDTKPIWLYCAQGNHCGAGMVGVINPPQDKTIEGFKAKAKEVRNTTATPPEIVAGTGGKLETCAKPPVSSGLPVASGTGGVPIASGTGGVPAPTGTVVPPFPTSAVGFSTIASPSVIPVVPGSSEISIPTGSGGAANATRTGGTPATTTGPLQFTGAASSFTVNSGILGGLVAFFVLFM